MKISPAHNFNDVFSFPAKEFPDTIKQGIIAFHDSKNLLRIFNADNLEKRMEVQCNGNGAYLLVKDFLLVEDKHQLKKVNLSNTTTEIICHSPLANLKIIDNQFCLATQSEKDTGMYQSELIRIDTGEVIWKKNGPERFAYFAGGSLYYTNRQQNLLVQIEPATGKEIWRIEIQEKPGGAARNLITYKDMLIVPYDQTRLMAIDKKNGTVIWDRGESFFSYLLHDEKLYSLNRDKFHSIDIFTGNTVSENTFSLLADKWPNGPVPARCTMHEGNLFFTSGHQGLFLGKINLTSNALEFYAQIRQGKTASVFPPVFYHNYMFIYDTNYVLNSFKIEFD